MTSHEIAYVDHYQSYRSYLTADVDPVERAWDVAANQAVATLHAERAAARTVADLLRLPAGRTAVRALGGKKYSAETDALARRPVVRQAAAILAARAKRAAARSVAVAARTAVPDRMVLVLADLRARRREATRKEIAATLLPRANYRTATNGHAERVVIVTDGRSPRAVSDTGVDRTVYRGSFKGWAATTSEHEYHVRETWMDDVYARDLGRVDGLLTLDADPVRGHGPELFRAVWVEQGKGTSLNTVHGYIARIRGTATHTETTYHAATARAALDGVLRKAGQKPARRKGTMDLDRLARRHGDLPVYWQDARDCGLCAPGIRSWCNAVDLPTDRCTVAEVVRGYKLRPLPEVISVLRRVVRDARNRHPVATESIVEDLRQASALEVEGRVVFDAEGGFRIVRDDPSRN